MLVYVRYYPVIGPFLPLQGTSLHETFIDTDSTVENVILPTVTLGAMRSNKVTIKNTLLKKRVVAE